MININGFRNGHNWGGDFSQYIHQAKSLVDGNINELLTISKVRYTIEGGGAPIFYPWGYPLLLSPVYYFFGVNILAFKVLNILFFLLSLIVIFFLYKDKLGCWISIMITTLMAFNPYFFEFKENVISDIPFLFFSLFSIYLIQRFVRDRRYFINELYSYCLIGMLIFYSYWIRPNGIILLPTLLVVQFIENKLSVRKFISFLLNNKIHLIPYVIFSLILVIAGFLLPYESGHADKLSNVNINNIIDGIAAYIIMTHLFFSLYFLPVKISMFIYYITIPFVVIGISKRHRDDYLYLIFSGLTLGIYVIWPGYRDLRFIFPLLPFFLYFLFSGINIVESYLARSFKVNFLKNIKLSSMIGTGLVFIFGIVIINKIHDNIIFNKSNVIDGPYAEDALELFDFISSNTKAEDTIVFFKPRVMSLYTGHKSGIVYNLDKMKEVSSVDDDEMVQHTGILIYDIDKIKNSGIKYIAHRKDNPEELLAFDNQYEMLDNVFENGTFILYSLKKLFYPKDTQL